MNVIAPVFSMAQVSPMVEAVAGSAIARVVYSEGHRKKLPRLPETNGSKVLTERGLAVQKRRKNVAWYRLQGLTYSEIARLVRSTKETVLNDCNIMKRSGELPEIPGKEVA